MSIFDNRFRLVDDPGDSGLHCSAAGISLGEAPLLRRTVRGFEPRAASEIEALLEAAYGASADSAQVRARLALAAQALSRGDIARAMIAALQMRLARSTLSMRRPASRSA